MYLGVFQNLHRHFRNLAPKNCIYHRNIQFNQKMGLITSQINLLDVQTEKRVQRVELNSME